MTTPNYVAMALEALKNNDTATAQVFATLALVVAINQKG